MRSSLGMAGSRRWETPLPKDILVGVLFFVVACLEITTILFHHKAYQNHKRDKTSRHSYRQSLPIGLLWFTHVVVMLVVLFMIWVLVEL